MRSWSDSSSPAIKENLTGLDRLGADSTDNLMALATSVACKPSTLGFLWHTIQDREGRHRIQDA